MVQSKRFKSHYTLDLNVEIALDALDTGTRSLNERDWAVLELPDKEEAIWEMVTVTAVLGTQEVAAPKC